MMLSFNCLVFSVGLISLSLGVGIVLKARLHADKGTMIARMFGNLVVILSLLVLICSLYSAWQLTGFLHKDKVIDNILNENRNLINIVGHNNNMCEAMMHKMVIQKMKMPESSQPIPAVPTTKQIPAELKADPAAVNSMPEMISSNSKAIPATTSTM